ncbi:hypothetical protein BANRA_03949 [Acinetobacter baumannii]|nr:hypothetical protein BANRA_03949 [Acinetobacter baumannii]
MKLLFGEDVISSDFEGLQSLLKQYYEKRKRPLCLCTNNGVEMYIAKINESYILKECLKQVEDIHQSV